MYERFGPAPYVGIWLFWRPALVVLSPLIARNVLVKDAENFRNRLIGGGRNDPIGALNIFTVDVSKYLSIMTKHYKNEKQ